jgi:nicotinamidase-related amidase
MSIPILVSEQYPEGIGGTHSRIAALLTGDCIVEKIHFSCFAEEACRSRIAAADRPQVILVGTEAHVCVLQTALELQQAAYDVFVVGDAISSRFEDDRALAILRMHRAGITVVSTEMVLFEWLARANTPLFKDMLSLIKQCDSDH